MKTYDVIVVGSGSGANIVDEALNHGFKVALVDRGPLGGTCLNLGCIPSKMLVYPADRIIEIQEAAALGINAGALSVDFGAIMERMRQFIDAERQEIRRSYTGVQNLDLYEATGSFSGDNTLEVAGETIKGDKIFIACGTRPSIPAIKGLDKIDYLTNESLLRLRECPESLIVIGGGYISVEYAHFFAAMGAKVTILEVLDRLVTAEEPEISALLKTELAKRLDIVLNVSINEIRQEGNKTVIEARDNINGLPARYAAARVLVATGRRPNTDLLRLEKTGVELDARGFVKTNEFMESNRGNIWVCGDADGKQMFTHVANREAGTAAHNAFHEKEKVAMNYAAAPHAVFSHPNIAAFGMTEEQAKKEHEIAVGRARYFDVAKGIAMQEKNGFAKAVVEKETGQILGFHIIGPEATTLIQEVINASSSGGGIDCINSGMHIHPALPELIERTLGNLEDV